jgi:hypothetical protein
VRSRGESEACCVSATLNEIATSKKTAGPSTALRFAQDDRVVDGSGWQIGGWNLEPVYDLPEERFETEREPVPGAKAQILPPSNAWAEAQAYLRDNGAANSEK